MSNGQSVDGGDSSMTEQAQEKVQQTAMKAKETSASYLREQTEMRAAQVSDQLDAVAQAMRKSGHQLHADGNEQAGKIVDGATSAMERVSGYLGEADGNKMLRDVENFGRRAPWGMIGIGVGIGLVAARFLKASSTNRYQSSQSSGQQQAARPMLPPPPPMRSNDDQPTVVVQGSR